MAVNKHSAEWIIIRKMVKEEIEKARRALEIVGTPSDLTNALRGQIALGCRIIESVEGETVIVHDDTSEPLVI